MVNAVTVSVALRNWIENGTTIFDPTFGCVLIEIDNSKWQLLFSESNCKIRSFITTEQDTEKYNIQ